MEILEARANKYPLLHHEKQKRKAVISKSQVRWNPFIWKQQIGAIQAEHAYFEKERLQAEMITIIVGDEFHTPPKLLLSCFKAWVEIKETLDETAILK